VKPAPFDYARPASVDEAVALLAARGDDAVALAGGQSLIAALNMRLSAPALVVDLGGIAALRGISIEHGALRIGALARHAEVAASAEVAARAPLIAMAMPHVAHPAIRNRGTFGGSLAQADPAAELPACLIALGGAVEIAGPKGARTAAAADFFKGLYETDLAPGEIVTAATIPAAGADARSAFGELARRHGDYALAGLAAHGRMKGGTIEELRPVFFGVGATAVLAKRAAAALAGKPLGDQAMAVAEAALDDDLDPFDEVGASARLKRHLAKVLLRRVVGEFAAGGGAT
jgi:carbon-monoxide dehydrogenase medium subunit